MDVIEKLRVAASRDRELVRARDLMIDILEEAVGRLRGAGFAPDLDLGVGNDLVVLRLDFSAWLLSQVSLPVRFERRLAVVPREGVASAADLPNVAGPILAPVAGTDDRAKAKPGGVAPKTYTPEVNVRIVEMRKRMATKDIALEIGVTVKSLEVQFSKLRKQGWDVPPPFGRAKPFQTAAVRRDGVVLRAWSAEDDRRLVEAYDAGRPTLSDVAAELGRSLSALTKRLTHLRRSGLIKTSRGIVPLDRKWPEDRIARLRELWPVARAADIAAEFGLSRGAVTGMGHRLGLGPSYTGPAPDAVVSAVDGSEQKSGHVSEAAAEPVSEQEVRPMPVVEPVPVIEPVPEVPAAQMLDPVPTALPAMEGRAYPMPSTGRGVLSSSMTLREKQGLISDHLYRLPGCDQFDAELDLELCEAVFSGPGMLPKFASEVGVDEKGAIARFNAIVAPLRVGGGKALPIEAGALILPALRARVQRARGASA